MNNKIDIEHRLKNLIKELKTDPLTIFRITTESREGLANDLENILADRERLIKENENWEKYNLEKEEDITELNNRLFEAEAKANKYDSLVEEIKEKIEWLRENILENDYASDNDKDIAEYQVNALQELLDTEK